MEFWVSKIRIRLEDGLCKLSAKYPDTEFISWYLWNKILLKFTADTDAREYIETDLKRYGYNINEASTQDQLAMIIMEENSDSEDNLFRIMNNNKCFDLPPTVYRDGCSEVRIASFDEKNLTRFISEITSVGSAEVLTKKKYPLNVLRSSIWLNGLFSSLTERQAQCFLHAQEQGYYEIPRNTTTGKLCAGIGIQRTAFERHLRKAEDTIMNSIAPYLRLFYNYKEKDFHGQTLDLIS